MISFPNDISRALLNRSLSETHDALAKNMEKLATGSRIPTPADDPASFARNEMIGSEEKSLQQAQRNAMEAQGMIDIADSGLSEVSNLIVRLRELAMQGASSEASEQDHEIFRKEAEELVNEIRRISETTSFLGTPMISGEGDLSFLVGTHGEMEDFITYPRSEINATPEFLGVEDIHVEDAEAAQDSLQRLDEALSKVSSMRALVGGIQTRLDISLHQLQGMSIGLAERQSAIADVDYAQESSLMVANNIKQASTLALMAQSRMFSSEVVGLLRQN